MLATTLDYITSGLNIFIGVANVYFIYLVYKFTTRDINPKLSMTPIKGEPFTYPDGNFENDIKLQNIDFNQKGFPDASLRHDEISWMLKIKNYSDLPAINVRVDYSIIIKRAKYDYDEDCTEVYNHTNEGFYTINNCATYPYIGAQSEIIEPLLSLFGNFLEADLIVNDLKSDELQFIIKPLRVDTYKHPLTNELEDSNHYRQFIGAYKPLSK